MTTTASSPPRAAIVGGGFSGVMTLSQLVRRATAPLAIHLIDPGPPRHGAAYSTQDASHLLNVRARQMGALAGQPEDFTAWLATPEGASAAARFGNAPPSPTAFLPRMLYGEYLEHRLHQALQLALEKNIEVRLHRTRALSAAPAPEGLTLTLETGETLHAHAVVLATGNAPPQSFSFAAALSPARYVRDVWQPGVFPASLHGLTHCVILGTGLTMIDTVLLLQSHGFQGAITALSRRGLLPAAHAPEVLPPYPAWMPHAATALGLLREVRAEIHRTEADWRSVIDAMRPATVQLWRGLPPREQARFLRRLLPYWNIHRHRVAPEIHAVLAALTQAGRFTVRAAGLERATETPQGLTLTTRAGEVLRADLLINCTGPSADVMATGNPLLLSLAAQGLITPHPLRCGIAAAQGGAGLFPIGPLMTGEYLETTAVPELRDQAAGVAEQVLARLFPPPQGEG